jgi:hypothetical protein
MICGCEQRFNGVSVLRASGYPNAYRKGGLFSVLDESARDSLRNLHTRSPFCFWENESELVSTLPRRRIDDAAMELENTRQPTQCSVARKMALGVVYSLQPIQV